MAGLLTFAELIDRFHREHQAGAGSNPWALRLLHAANAQFGGRWTMVELTGDEAREIILPGHSGEPCQGDRMTLIPDEGLTVRGAAARVREIEAEYRRANPTCWSRIAEIDRTRLSPVAVSVEPLDHGEYAALTARPGALYHLDGFHRLIGWELAGALRADVTLTAYVAGGRRP